MNESFIDVPVFEQDAPLSVSLAGISHQDKNYSISRKNSPCYCIEYVISGCGTVKTQGKTFHPKQGDTYFLMAGDDHEYYSHTDDPWEKIWINLSGSLADALTGAYNLRKSVVFHCNTKSYIENIHSILSSKDLSVKEIEQKAAIVFHEMMQFLSENKNGPKTLTDAEIIKNHIDLNLYSQLNINKLARLIYKSPAQTIRIFKKAYNMTPYDYYMENRIKKAVLMLQDTGFSVKEIAYTLGFCDEHYFSNVIRNKTGKKPSDFRINNSK